jgi:heterodisulfide reductase subunit B
VRPESKHLIDRKALLIPLLTLCQCCYGSLRHAQALLRRHEAVRDAVARQNANIPGGNLTGPQREQVLRTMGRLERATS